ncbi:HupE/UreJ family protein [Thiothrix fructosivorans]|uniref:HupE/UreJ family protein n=1 Tax=Thiothrix fructosivorans TaxID=111770 RepID=A0A8B0SM20_9GAMM|nr:HupE/UreJ family protein [Thiothrix fructosivorans]MBO0612519.1 HupE/UreJ family protein [Thiothrix fructosivorans]QTX12004.1 HupE/UreJ family protein [Thiothrix fructosivorans]
MMTKTRLHFLWGICLLLLPLLAVAHKPSDSYLFLQDQPEGNIGLRWDIALRDLEQAIGLDSDADGKITWGELQHQQTALDAYALSRLHLQQGDAACQPQVTGLQTETHTDGGYAVLLMNAGCPATAGGALQVEYRLLFDIDPTHRGILLDQRAGSESASYIFSTDHPKQALTLQNSGGLPILLNYIREGIHHILNGFDHLLFIALLILPAVLVLKERQWQQVESFRPALINLLKVITAFTLAHSITLSLAVLGVVDLPSRLVESAIALSIIVVAVNILYPLITHDQWKLVFVFGLLHGFGFASVLRDMQMPTGALAEALFGFNVGVEIGQLLLVLLVFPIAYSLRASKVYRVQILHGSAVLALIVSGVWFVERAFDLRAFWS